MSNIIVVTLPLASCGAALHTFARFEQLYPYECQERLVDIINTGDEITVDLDTDTLTNHASGEEKKKTSNGSMDYICSAASFSLTFFLLVRESTRCPFESERQDVCARNVRATVDRLERGGGGHGTCWNCLLVLQQNNPHHFQVVCPPNVGRSEGDKN